MFQAYCEVWTPDYIYWRPVPETRSDNPQQCLVLAQLYADQHIPAARQSGWGQRCKAKPIRPAQLGE